MRSENTRREWRRARQRGVCVYPVKGVPAAGSTTQPSEVDEQGPFLRSRPRMAEARCTPESRMRATRVPFMAPPCQTVSSRGRARPTADRDAAGSRAREAGGHHHGADGAPAASARRRWRRRSARTTTSSMAFDDGILWVTLGQPPNVLNELIELLRGAHRRAAGFVDVEDAAVSWRSARRQELSDRHRRRWNATHAAPFLRGAPSCARLITTRLFEVAADARRVDVDRWSLRRRLGCC